MYDTSLELNSKFLDKYFDKYYDSMIYKKGTKEKLGFKYKPINLKVKGYEYDKFYNETSDEDYDDYYEEKEYRETAYINTPLPSLVYKPIMVLYTGNVPFIV